MTSAGPAMPRSEAAALLGVPETASHPEVQRAYLRAARTTHPDLLIEVEAVAAPPTCDERHC